MLNTRLSFYSVWCICSVEMSEKARNVKNKSENLKYTVVCTDVKYAICILLVTLHLGNGVMIIQV